MGYRDIGKPKGYTKSSTNWLGYKVTKQYSGTGRCVGERVHGNGLFGTDSNFGTMKKNRRKF